MKKALDTSTAKKRVADGEVLLARGWTPAPYALTEAEKKEFQARELEERLKAISEPVVSSCEQVNKCLRELREKGGQAAAQWIDVLRWMSVASGVDRQKLLEDAEEATPEAMAALEPQRDALVKRDRELLALCKGGLKPEESDQQKLQKTLEELLATFGALQGQQAKPAKEPAANRPALVALAESHPLGRELLARHKIELGPVYQKAFAQGQTGAAYQGFVSGAATKIYAAVLKKPATSPAVKTAVESSTRQVGSCLRTAKTDPARRSCVEAWGKDWVRGALVAELLATDPTLAPFDKSYGQCLEKWVLPAKAEDPQVLLRCRSLVRAEAYEARLLKAAGNGQAGKELVGKVLAECGLSVFRKGAAAASMEAFALVPAVPQELFTATAKACDLALAREQRKAAASRLVEENTETRISALARSAGVASRLSSKAKDYWSTTWSAAVPEFKRCLRTEYEKEEKERDFRSCEEPLKTRFEAQAKLLERFDGLAGTKIEKGAATEELLSEGVVHALTCLQENTAPDCASAAAAQVGLKVLRVQAARDAEVQKAFASLKPEEQEERFTGSALTEIEACFADSGKSAKDCFRSARATLLSDPIYTPIPEVVGLADGQVIPPEVFRKYPSERIGYSIVKRQEKFFPDMQRAECQANPNFDWLKDAEIHMAFHDQYIDSIVAGCFQNQHQASHSQGSYRPSGRARAEDGFIGALVETNYRQGKDNPANEVRPKYAHVVITKNRSDMRYSEYWAGYGNILAVMKKDVQKRATFTPTDSLGTGNTGNVRPMTYRGCTMVERTGSYFEGQIWGKVCIKPDVDYFLVNCPGFRAASNDGIQKLKATGVPVYSCVAGGDAHGRAMIKGEQLR